MTEVDLATMNRVAAPAASPDGRWVAYQMTETAPETYKRSTGLWLIDRKAKDAKPARIADARSEEHTSELQSLMRISYAVFCLKKKNKLKNLERLDYISIL